MLNPFSIYDLGGVGNSLGNFAYPTGMLTKSSFLNTCGFLLFSLYMRIEEWMVPVNQYKVIFASNSSLLHIFSICPLLSLQALNFSSIQAQSPIGESINPSAKVKGLVACIRDCPPCAAYQSAALLFDAVTSSDSCSPSFR